MLKAAFPSVFATSTSVADADAMVNIFIEQFQKVRALLGQIEVLTNKLPGSNPEYVYAFDSEGRLVDRGALRGIVEGAWQTVLEGLRTQAIVMTLLTMDADPSMPVNMRVESASIPHVSVTLMAGDLSYTEALALQARSNSYASLE